MSRWHRVLAVTLMMAVGACSKAPEVTREAGEGSTERYVVLGSYIAEIVVALGATESIVGVSGGTDHISELSDVPVVRGFRNLSAETILSLGPTTALLAGRQTRPELAEQLRQSGVQVRVFPDEVASLHVVSERIREIAALLDSQAAGEALVTEFERDLKDAIAFAAGAESRPRGLFILSGGGRPTVVAGGDTHIALLMELAGAENVTQAISYFKPMSQEAMLEAAPEFILVNEEGLQEKGGLPVALSAPGATLTPAAQSGNVFSLPGGYLQGLGLNSPRAIRAIARRIHPELAGSR